MSKGIERSGDPEDIGDLLTTKTSARVAAHEALDDQLDASIAPRGSEQRFLIVEHAASIADSLMLLKTMLSVKDLSRLLRTVTAFSMLEYNRNGKLRRTRYRLGVEKVRHSKQQNQSR